MSDSARIRIVRAYLESLDNTDIDDCFKYVTDDFVYEAEPKPVGLGYTDSGFGKAEYKEYCTKIGTNHYGFKTSIDSFTEDTHHVVIKAKTNFSYNIPATASTAARIGTDTSPHTATYTFSGDKIRHVKVVADSAFMKKFTE